MGRRHKPVCTFLLCSSCFLLSLPCVSNAGQYVFQIMDEYGGGMSVLWIAIFEMVCISWIYGANNIGKDFNFMLDISLKRIPSLIGHVVLVTLWTLIPLLLMIITGLSLWKFEQPIYGGNINYLCHPKKRFMDVFRPTPEWGPGDRSQKKLWLEKKRPRHVLQGYDNPTMAYPYYNYAGYGGYHHGHM